jgi:molybdate transport system substrate-binding protein
MEELPCSRIRRMTIRGISSMATRPLLAELAAAWSQRSGQAVTIESVGGVDAARRVAAGEAFDVVLLASDAIDKLITGGHLAAGSRVDLVRSPVAIAVREGAARPDVSSAAAVKAAVLAAKTLAHSTGPSGAFILGLFERWGIAGQMRPRIVQAPPGVPVGRLVAQGEVELGFQQLSELMSLPGITVLGTLPAEIAHLTTFSAGIPPATAQADMVRAMLAWMNSPEAAAAKHRHGMTPIE